MEWTLQTDTDSPITQWFGIYRGVSWEIHNWQRPSVYDGEDDRQCWSYYLRLSQLQFAPEEWSGICLPVAQYGHNEFPDYDWRNSTIYDIYWHGGISYYRNTTRVDQLVQSCKWGCDYGHSGDDEVRWSLEMVQYDVRHTIDELCALYPLLKWRCGFCGEYETPDEEVGFFARDGSWWEHYACVRKWWNGRSESAAGGGA